MNSNIKSDHGLFTVKEERRIITFGILVEYKSIKSPSINSYLYKPIKFKTVKIENEPGGN